MKFKNFIFGTKLLLGTKIQSNLKQLVQQIESLIFTAVTPISFKEISNCLEESFGMKFHKEELQKSIDFIRDRYAKEEFAFELTEIGGGYQFLSKGSYHNTIGTYLKQTTRKRLSRAAMETLSIIAYKQPVTKSEMENIRGVSCDYSIQKLLEKELVSILGRSDAPGRPLLYGSSPKFMDYFGINSLEDLPKPKDFKNPDSEVGEKAPIEEPIETISIADLKEKVETLHQAEQEEMNNLSSDEEE